jgi:hypothetical protein
VSRAFVDLVRPKHWHCHWVHLIVKLPSTSVQANGTYALILWCAWDGPKATPSYRLHCHGAGWREWMLTRKGRTMWSYQLASRPPLNQHFQEMDRRVWRTRLMLAMTRRLTLPCLRLVARYTCLILDWVQQLFLSAISESLITCTFGLGDQALMTAHRRQALSRRCLPSRSCCTTRIISPLTFSR